MTGLLEGVKVIDMGQVVAVPATGGMLADWGAEVIKVEPLTGEMARGASRGAVGVTGAEANWGFQLHNKNKKGLALDLKQEAGREILYRLVRQCDVFMSNYEVESLKRLKLDYATLSRYNPKLVYGILTGYGTVGPDKDERGYDYSAAWARSGIQYLIGEPKCPLPAQRNGMMDRMVAGYIAAGILAALIYSGRTGKGQEVEFSLYHTGVWAVASDIENTLKGISVKSNDRLNPASPLSNCYFGSDGRWFRLSMPQADAYWPKVCQVIDKPELENDPQFNNREMLGKNAAELVPILDNIFATRTRAEWEKRFRENQCIFGRVQSPVEVISDPQALANDFFADMSVPGIGDIKVVTAPIKFRQNPATIRSPAPEVGQHTEEILLGLGYTWQDISRLREQHVVL